MPLVSAAAHIAADTGPSITVDVLHFVLSLGGLGDLILKGFCALPFVPC